MIILFIFIFIKHIRSPYTSYHDPTEHVIEQSNTNVKQLNEQESQNVYQLMLFNYKQVRSAILYNNKC